MKTLLFMVSLASVGVVWALNRMTTADLRAQIELARLAGSDEASLQSERERLLRLQREAEENERRERARAQQELAARAEPVRRPPPSTLTVGEWLPLGAWKNRGQTTPTATVETALWAAAGGDIATLKDVVQLDGAVRAKAEAILARLPDSARATYATPEHLIAAFTTKSVPLGDAQLVWQHQAGPDEAVACVFVKNVDANVTSPSATPLPAGTPGKVPPMGPATHRTIATYLSLRRTEEGWRLVVPMSAVDKIALELRGEKQSAAKNSP